MDFIREKTALFTGHRIIPYKDIPKIKAGIERAVSFLYQKGVRAFVCGGAVGFDMLAEETVIALKEKYPDITLSIVLPCRDSDIKWNGESKARQRRVLSLADSVEVLSEEFYSYCMAVRNNSMVDRSAYCIAYITKLEGGTYGTVTRCLKKGLTVINTAEL